MGIESKTVVIGTVTRQRPYAAPETVEITQQRLLSAERQQTHLQRYVLRESGRGRARVGNLEILAARKQIGKGR